jgi:hypothetical protein
MSIGVMELVLLAICGAGLLIGVAVTAVYFIRRDRER